jgi:hypothetical protein
VRAPSWTPFPVAETETPHFPARLSATSYLLAQNPVHLGTAGRARALSGTPTVGELDLIAVELPLLPTFNAVALVRRHVGLLALLRPAKGSNRTYCRGCLSTWMLRLVEVLALVTCSFQKVWSRNCRRKVGNRPLVQRVPRHGAGAGTFPAREPTPSPVVNDVARRVPDARDGDKASIRASDGEEFGVRPGTGRPGTGPAEMGPGAGAR